MNLDAGDETVEATLRDAWAKFAATDLLALTSFVQRGAYPAVVAASGDNEVFSAPPPDD